MTLQQALEAAETAMKFADGHVIIEAEASQKLLRVSMLTPLLANALRMSVNTGKTANMGGVYPRDVEKG